MNSQTRRFVYALDLDDLMHAYLTLLTGPVRNPRLSNAQSKPWPPNDVDTQLTVPKAVPGQAPNKSSRYSDFAEGGKRRLKRLILPDYNGPRTAKDLADYSAEQMPSHVKKAKTSQDILKLVDESVSPLTLRCRRTQFDYFCRGRSRSQSYLHQPLW